MRCLNRNKVAFYFALYKGTEAVKDEYGNETGENRVLYENPAPGRANISPAKGDTQAQMFGAELNYDKAIVFENGAYPIDEYTVLWIESAPELNEDGSLKTDTDGKVLTPHDYVVKTVASGLNFVSVAVSKVNAGG